MTEETALRAAVVAEPDEDTPRLAYADWLDENRPSEGPSPAAGPSARAEFIRAQCRLATGAYHALDYAELLDRQYDLATWLTRHDPDAEADVGLGQRDLANFIEGATDYGEWDFYHRGFPEVLDLTACLADDPSETVAAIEAALEDASARSPAQTLRLDDANSEEIARLVRRPVFSTIRGLYLDGVEDNDYDEAFAALASSRHSRGLRRLLIDQLLDDHVVDEVAQSPYLGRLESLTITYPVSARSIKTLGQAKWFRNLRRLNLWLGYDSGLKAIADLPKMSRLESLTLNESEPTTAATVRRFAASDAFPALSRLELKRTRLSADQVVALARGRWPLRHLRLESNEVRKAGVEALVAAAFAPTLQVLELPWCQITAGGVRLLANADSLAGLRRLDIVGNPVGPGGLDAIAEGRPLRRLRGLSLGYTDTPRGPLAARYVSRFLSRLETPDLRHLDMQDLPVGVRGAQVLASAPTFANLTKLDLQGCNLGEAGTRHLIDSKRLPNLVVLDMNGNKTGRSAGPLLKSKVLPRLAWCRLGHGVPKGTATRLRRRPGIVI